MNRIRILSDKIISMIAAGEVIERPSSVVRELVENSIDASAKIITVKVEKGGIDLIKVIDNGIGMSRDDLLLCIERHATSKIKNENDLRAISTMGFRGEAIPSIAAVSKMRITSRLKGQLSGYKLTIDGGRLRTIKETGAPEGTIVEVRDLFYCVPARRKFLKGIRTETAHIIDTFSRIALPYNNIQFHLENNGKIIMSFPSDGDLLNRIRISIGKEVTESMKVIQLEGEGFLIKGYAASPEMSRSRSDRLYIYVNNRNIKDRMLMRAVMEGYGQRLMRGTYPQAFIFIQIKRELVDVNVHPAKQEARFRDPRSLYQAIIVALRDALMSAEYSIKIHDITRPYVREYKTRNTGLKESFIPYGEWKDGPREVKVLHVGDRFLFDDSLKVIGQVKNTYIICETKEGLFIVDQHAAHERIIYERLKKSIRESKNKQVFLFPYQLELSVKESMILRNYIETVKDIGIEVEDFGGSSFLLRAAPIELTNVDLKLLMSEVISMLDKKPPIHKVSIIDNILKIMACHSAIRAGDSLEKDEMENLIEQLKKTTLPHNCPHGRPVFKKFSFQEIEKIFKRQL